MYAEHNVPGSSANVSVVQQSLMHGGGHNVSSSSAEHNVPNNFAEEQNASNSSVEEHNVPNSSTEGPNVPNNRAKNTMYQRVL